MSDVVMYLPEGPIDVFAVGDDKEDNFDAFTQRLVSILAEVALSRDVLSYERGPILEGIDTCEALSKAGDEWAEKMRLVIDSGAPLPPWIENRMAELRSQNGLG